ncbi:MAG: DUF4276 family protein [Treponema sp.]|jgi:hypothetical protein|nr:DUF4276 family protein [Treponema sp.]
MKIYVEGGGDSHLLKTACRKGFSEFVRKAGLEGKMPKIVACGGRKAAYDAFSIAAANGEPAILLVDSEAPIDRAHQQGALAAWTPWEHLKNRTGDGWPQPGGTSGTACHLMVQCMEAWFFADRITLAAYFGQGFNNAALPPEHNPIEDIEKGEIYRSLKNATKNTKTKGKYDKGEHSFKILELIDPQKVSAASPWAKRFIDALVGED